MVDEQSLVGDDSVASYTQCVCVWHIAPEIATDNSIQQDAASAC